MDVAALHQGYSSSMYAPRCQLEALKQQNSKYQDELSSENQRIGVLRKEICDVTAPAGLQSSVSSILEEEEQQVEK